MTFHFERKTNVHLEVKGAIACGKAVRTSDLGWRVTRDPAKVTCPKCAKIAKVQP